MSLDLFNFLQFLAAASGLTTVQDKLIYEQNGLRRRFVIFAPVVIPCTVNP